MRWKTGKLVSSTAPNTRTNTDNDSKNRKRSHWSRSQSEMSMVRHLWQKRFTKKVSFEFRVKEWRGDGWGKWRRGDLFKRGKTTADAPHLARWCILTSPQWLPELVHEAACELNFMVFTNILDSYYIKILIFYRYVINNYCRLDCS